MAKKEIFQAILNNLLVQIRDDAVNCLEKPPEKDVANYTKEDLSDKALEYHEKGAVGVYLYYMVLLELKTLEDNLKGKK